MTVQQLALIVSLLSSSISSSAAFAPPANVMLPQQPQQQQQQHHATRLMMSPTTGTTTSTNPTMRPMTEEQAQYILNKARECALMDGSLVDDLIEHGGHIEHSANPLDDIIAASDDAAAAAAANNNDSAQLQQPSSSSNVHFTIDDARYLLREMIHIQSNCVTGQVVGKELCDDQDTAAEIVANLRYKIDKYERRLAKRQKGSDSSVPLVATELSLGALVLVVAVFWTTLDMSGGGGGLSGGPDGVDMMAATSSSSSATPSLQLNNFNDWLGVFQERYLGAKDAIVS